MRRSERPAMIAAHTRLSRYLAMRLLRRESGMAAVEFALILPILVVLWLGGVELTGALSVDRRLNNLASAVGDLVARDKEITHAEVDDIFALSEAALFPYSDTGIAMRVTAINIDEDENATVAWTRMQGTLPGGVPNYSVGQDMDDILPEDLKVEESQVIMSEVYHSYTPAVGYVITGEIQLSDRMFFVPRLITYISLCEDADDDDCLS